VGGGKDGEEGGGKGEEEEEEEEEEKEEDPRIFERLIFFNLKIEKNMAEAAQPERGGRGGFGE